jgi:D-glycero-D-manno-heptose 1,7-bisphosphate phosphatase
VSRFDTVFLDRDGTLNVPAAAGGYVTAPGELVLLPGAGAAVRRLNDSGRRVVLVSNQRGVARGRMTAADLEAVQRRLHEMLAGLGARLDAAYLCPHAAGECDCRKPLPGLLLRAAAELPGVRLDRAVTIGDAESDVAAGRAAGTATVRLGPPGTSTAADALVADLSQAVDWVLGAG